MARTFPLVRDTDGPNPSDVVNISSLAIRPRRDYSATWLERETVQ